MEDLKKMKTHHQIAFWGGILIFVGAVSLLYDKYNKSTASAAAKVNNDNTSSFIGRSAFGNYKLPTINDINNVNGSFRVCESCAARPLNTQSHATNSQS